MNQLISEMAAAGVDRAVLVPPAFEGDRNEVVLDAAARHPDLFGVMGRLAIDAPDSPSRIAQWLDTPGMLGIRLSFFMPEHRKLLFDGSAEWFWPAAEAAGIPLYIFAPGLLTTIGDVAKKHPRLRIALSHFALAPDAELRDLELALNSLLDLAPIPNVAVTASALPCHAADAYPFRSLRPSLEKVVHAFSPRRIFWGSDITRAPCSYLEAAQYMKLLDIMEPTDLDLVMGESLMQWIGWKPLDERGRAE